jgi:hypothetical protein
MSDNLEMPKTFAELEAYTSSILASQQSAHDAEIARLKEDIDALQESWAQEKLLVESRNQMLNEANAACAMKDEALKVAHAWLSSAYSIPPQTPEAVAMLQSVSLALSATSQQVSEWERKQLEPLRAQAAALRGSLVGLLNSPIDIGCAKMARETLDNIQATAEQFIAECEQRGAVKALEDAANWFILRGPDGTSIDGDAESAESLRKMARDIRATSKKAG